YCTLLLPPISTPFPYTTLFRSTVTDGTPVRRLDKGEILDAPQAQMQHLQYHRREVGTQYLRVGKGRTAVEVLFAVQPHADTRRHPPTTALALIGTGPGNRLDRQTLHLGARTVAADAHLARVNHVDDARHRE